MYSPQYLEVANFCVAMDTLIDQDGSYMVSNCVVIVGLYGIVNMH